MSNEFLFLILGFLLGILIYKLFDSVFYTKVYTQTVETPQSADNNDYVKWVMDCRNTTINMVVHCLQSAWFLEPESKSELSIVQLDLDSMLAVLPYQNYLFRWYFDWKHNIMTVGFTTNKDDKHFIERKSFKIKGGCLNLEKIYMYFVKLQKKYYKEPESELLELTEDSLKMLLEKVAAEEKDIPASIKEFWTQWRDDIFNNGADKEDMAKFIYFTLAVQHNEKEEVSQ